MTQQDHDHGPQVAARSGGGSCGCGGGGGGGCGGDAASAPAAVLSIDPRLDVRDIPHERRHATVLDTVDVIPAGGALVLVAPHAPRPLLAEIDTRYPGGFTTEWLQSGPEVWQVRLRRTAG